jgi:2-polyprenyl-6-methoxyphenol hydroxylase-like FAD-dependent oxidoreductase
MVMTHPSTRILVLGAGIAGLLFTLRLAGKVAREPVQITLIDELDTFTSLDPRGHRITIQVEPQQQQELTYDYLYRIFTQRWHPPDYQSTSPRPKPESTHH